jgi:hypothetical protein
MWPRRVVTLELALGVLVRLTYDLDGAVALDLGGQGGDVPDEGLPQDGVVDAVVDVRGQDPVDAYVVPWHRRHGGACLVGEPRGGVADPADHGLTGQP